MGDTNRNNIRVVCRFRPQNSREIREGGVPIINYDDNGDSCRMEVSTKFFLIINNRIAREK